VLGYVDVRFRRPAPDISATDIRSILKALEPHERKLLNVFAYRKRPTEGNLGDWGTQTTVESAIADQLAFNSQMTAIAEQRAKLLQGVNEAKVKLLREVSEAQAKLGVRLVDSNLKVNSSGVPTFSGTFSNSSPKTIGVFEGTVVFFFPPTDIRGCLRIAGSGAIRQSDRDTFIYELPPELSSRFHEIADPGVAADFVPTKVIHFGEEAITHIEPRNLCPGCARWDCSFVKWSAAYPVASCRDRQGPKSRSMVRSLPRNERSEQLLTGQHQRIEALYLCDECVPVRHAASMAERGASAGRTMDEALAKQHHLAFGLKFRRPAADRPRRMRIRRHYFMPP
jgi:hypothetical protein